VAHISVKHRKNRQDIDALFPYNQAMNRDDIYERQNAMALNLYMIGLITQDMDKSIEFYRRLGLDIPEDSHGKTHVEIKMPGGLTFFLDSAPFRFDPVFPRDVTPTPQVSPGRYPFLLEFYLKQRAIVDAKYNELTAFGYQSRQSPYVTSFGMYFAWVNDPDGNAILLSAD
jgi:catechol 2,3-dioxygenase-like lactoylglutathione lyase family enzyme